MDGPISNQFFQISGLKKVPKETRIRDTRFVHLIKTTDDVSLIKKLRLAAQNYCYKSPAPVYTQRRSKLERSINLDPVKEFNLTHEKILKAERPL